MPNKYETRGRPPKGGKKRNPYEMRGRKRTSTKVFTGLNIEKDLLKVLTRLAKKRKVSRNGLICAVLQEFVGFVTEEEKLKKGPFQTKLFGEKE